MEKIKEKIKVINFRISKKLEQAIIDTGKLEYCTMSEYIRSLIIADIKK